MADFTADFVLFVPPARAEPQNMATAAMATVVMAAAAAARGRRATRKSTRETI